MIDLSNSTRKTRFFHKDQAKAARSTKFIGRGSASSSTRAYAIAAGDRANSGRYDASDVVMISAEGMRSNRQAPDFVEINKAISARASFITDDKANRSRNYNLGEREVAAFLTVRGYTETAPGYWSPPS
ncbi:hypothetical protein [Croceicoccus mobilis]|uniref:Uncharacterized protein n=1 Tax=Croceicoccus mobilis TaxID=1703339 RepID=A0A916Z9W0_9SPHN|nr:hypothetical protein [Croceicoccus mobilis]GGD81842.1 hypothetical protein GCM10010990_34730 [Croceicoccus mobilis]